MPTYDYQCPKCQKIYAKSHGINEEVEYRCDDCRGVLRKKFGITTVIFKGNGFYTNDKFL